MNIGKLFEGHKTLSDSIAFHGGNRQISKTIEELAELIVAVQHYEDDMRHEEQKIDNVISEIADVLIMLPQLAAVMGIWHGDIESAIKRKLNRLQQRINKWEKQK